VHDLALYLARRIDFNLFERTISFGILVCYLDHFNLLNPTFARLTAPFALILIFERDGSKGTIPLLLFERDGRKGTIPLLLVVVVDPVLSTASFVVVRHRTHHIFALHDALHLCYFIQRHRSTALLFNLSNTTTTVYLDLAVIL
jgi:hypothetical protein